MKTTYDKETGLRTWGLSAWYEKAIYLFGWFYTIIMAVWFLVGVAATVEV